MCRPLGVLVSGHLHTSAEQRSHKKVSMWLQKWVDCIWRSFHCHPLSTKNGDSPGLVVGCQFAWTLPRCQLWLPLSTAWSGEEGHAVCRVDPALSAMHHWVWFPYTWKQRLWLCGFCLVSVCWSLGDGEGTRQSVWNWSLQLWCSFHPNLFWLFPRIGVSSFCPSPVSAAERATELWPWSSC